MRHFAVIGDPISHSRSPEVYAGIFAARGVEADCIRLLVKPHELVDIASIVSPFEGFAVTMPHKRVVMSYLCDIDGNALRCGSVNIVKNINGSLVGYNTDGIGLVNALLSKGFDPAGKSAVIYGRGGAALAAAYALSDSGADVKLLVRSHDTAYRLHDFEQLLFSDYNDRADIFINATPLGMAGGVCFDDFGFLNRIRPEFVFDMVYLDGRETELVKTARALGCGAADGYSMLYCQALLAADIWLGSE